MRLPEALRMTCPASAEEKLSPSDTSASLPLYPTPPVPAPPWLWPPSNSEHTQVNVNAPVPIPTLASLLSQLISSICPKCLSGREDRKSVCRTLNYLMGHTYNVVKVQVKFY